MLITGQIISPDEKKMPAFEVINCNCFILAEQTLQDLAGWDILEDDV